jgi:hypothetical protein
MSALSDSFALDLFKLIFWGTAIPNLADNAASAPLTNLYAALHTADPASGGNQSTNEIVYTSYARIAVARGSGGWSIGLFVSPNADIAFAKPTGAAGQVATFASIGFASSGAGKIIARGALSVPVTIAIGNAPIVLRGSSFSIG